MMRLHVLPPSPSADPAGLSLDGFEAVKRWYAAVECLPGWRQAIPAPGGT